MLDQGRLLELRDINSRLSVVGSVILLVNNTVGAPIHGISSFKKNIKEHLNALLDSVHSNKYISIKSCTYDFFFQICIMLKIYNIILTFAAEIWKLQCQILYYK